MDQKRWMTCNELVKAIEENNIGTVQKILNNGFDVDSELISGKSPIILCIERNRLKIGKIFISNGCSLSLKDSLGCTPLHVAVKFLKYDFVTLLLDNRADLTNIDGEGKTVLHIAAELNALKMVRLLMEKASSEILNLRDKEGKTPFIYACQHGNDSLISYFITKGCDVNSKYGPFRLTPLFSAIANHSCSADSLNKLLDAGANINHVCKSYESPLMRVFYYLSRSSSSIAAYSSSRDKCLLLIDKGSEVNVCNCNGNTPLHLATLNCDEFLVRKLLNAGSLVDVPNKLGFTPLFYACNRGFQNIADILIDCGANTKIIDIIFGGQNMQFNANLFNLPSTANSVLKNVALKSRTCQSLKKFCRLAVRRNLPKNIQKSAILLPLPQSLIKFILLVE